METWLLGIISRPILGRGWAEFDRRVAVQAWLRYQWRMLPLIHQHPKGYVLCPICYGSRAHDSGLCVFCQELPGQSSIPSGYVSQDYFCQHWDSLRWRPRRDWVGYRPTTYLPNYFVQTLSPLEQRRYREGQEARYKNWRTP